MAESKTTGYGAFADLVPVKKDTKKKEAPVTKPVEQSKYGAFSDLVSPEKGGARGSNTSTPNYGVFSDLIPAPKVEVKKPSISSKIGSTIDKITARPEVGSKREQTTLGQLPSATVENLPFGIGEIIRTAREEPETVADLTGMDVIKSLPNAGKEILKAYAISPIMTVLGGVKGEIKFNLPGLGEVTNAQYRAAERVRQGTSWGQAALEEAPNAIFDTLFFVGLAQKTVSGRPVTVAKGEAPTGIRVKEQPKSFRVYEEPTATSPLPKEYVARMAKEKGIDFGSKYNPELPTYFRMKGTANGKIVGEVVQIKPSYVETFINLLRRDTSKVPDNQVTTLIKAEADMKKLEQVRPTVQKVPEEVVNTFGEFRDLVPDATKKAQEIAKNKEITVPEVETQKAQLEKSKQQPITPKEIAESVPKLEEYELLPEVEEKSIVDWEENFAEEAAIRFDKIKTVEEEIKNANKSDRAVLEQELARLQEESARIENSFVDRWQEVNRARQEVLSGKAFKVTPEKTNEDTLLQEARKYKSAEEFASILNDSRVMNPKLDAVTTSPEFKAWFGNSKLIDPAGNVVKRDTPTVFYHRSSADFDNFLSRAELEKKGVKLPDYRDTDSGFYFSRKDSGDYYGDKKYAVALKAENPKSVRGDISSLSDSQIQKLKQQGYDAIESPDEIIVFDKEQIWPLTKNGSPIGKTKSQLTDIWERANKTKKKPAVLQKKSDTKNEVAERLSTIKGYVEYYLDTHGYPSLRGLKHFLSVNEPVGFNKTDVIKYYKENHPDKVGTEEAPSIPKKKPSVLSKKESASKSEEKQLPFEEWLKDRELDKEYKPLKDHEQVEMIGGAITAKTGREVSKVRALQKRDDKAKEIRRMYENEVGLKLAGSSKDSSTKPQKERKGVLTRQPRKKIAWRKAIALEGNPVSAKLPDSWGSPYFQVKGVQEPAEVSALKNVERKDVKMSFDELVKKQIDLDKAVEAKITKEGEIGDVPVYEITAENTPAYYNKLFVDAARSFLPEAKIFADPKSSRPALVLKDGDEVKAIVMGMYKPTGFKPKDFKPNEASPRAPGGLASARDLASPQGNKTIRKMLEKRNEAKVDEPQDVPKDFKISERAKAILEEFGIPVGERELSWRYLGLFKHREKKVRVQSLYDITTVTHEAIHAIDDKIGFTKKLIEDTKRGEKIRRQLTDIYEDLYPTAKREHKLDKRMKEGLAVLFENYFYDPAVTTASYPDLVDNFIKPSGRFYHPDFTKLLDRMNELVDDFAKLSPEERIASRIRTGKEVVREQKGFTWRQRTVFEVVNRFEPLKRYAKSAGVEETWADPTIQAFNIMNKNSIIYNWVKGKDTPVLLGNGNFRVDKGSVADYLALTKGSDKEWRAYLIARRVHEANNNLNLFKNEYEELGGLERKTELLNAKEDGKEYSMEEITELAKLTELENEINKIKKVIEADDFSTQDAAAVVEKYQEKFAEAEKIYDDINKKLIDQAEEAGLIDSATADKYRVEKGYASFRRFIDDELDVVGTIHSSSKSKVSSFKERTGSQLDIVDPVYSQILAINEIIGKSFENILWKKVANLAVKNPEIGQRFEKLETQAAVDANGRLSFPQEKDPNVVRIWNNGKREFYKAAPEFIAVQKTLRGKERDLFVTLLRIPSSIFTRLTTSANPLFAAGNISVDQFSATVQSKTGFKPVLDPAKSFYDYIVGDEGLQAYLAIGGKRQTLAAYFDLSPDEIVHKLTGGQTKLEKTSSYIDSTLGVLEMPSNTSEIITRFSEYKRSVDKGEPMSVAMYRATEVTTPFQLSGNFGGRLGQEYIKSIPYLNAIIQVLYKYGRTTKDNPERVATMTAAILAAALTTALWTMKNSSDKQKRLLSEQPVRNMSRYIYIPVAGGERLMRLRIPEQFGVFSGLAYLYAIQYYGGNKVKFDDYVDLITSTVPEQVNILQPKKTVLSYVPQVLKPSVLTSSNTKVFPDVAPIVPPFVIDQAPEKQYNAYTSETAKFVGEMLNASPMLIDFWVKNQFGVIGGLLVGKTPTNPVVIQEGEFVMSGRAYNRFYDNRTVVRQQYEEVVKDNPDAYGYEDKSQISATKTAYDRVSDLLSDMRKIQAEHELPEELRKGMYELLLKLDSTEDIWEVRNDISQLRSKINATRNELQVR